jgi:hypothetical protein
MEMSYIVRTLRRPDGETFIKDFPYNERDRHQALKHLMLLKEQGWEAEGWRVRA